MSAIKRVCGECSSYWKMGIPFGCCMHPDSMYLVTNDEMVFYDAGTACPLNKKENQEDVTIYSDFVKYMTIHNITSDPFCHFNVVLARLYEEYRKYGHLIIAYDFDYTVHSFRNEPVLYTEVMDLLRAWKSRGKFIVFSASPEGRYEYIRNYCYQHDLPVDKINEDILERPYTRKVYYNIFLDDRAGLSETLRVLKQLLSIIEKEEL